jgi:hypothetical protein
MKAKGGRNDGRFSKQIQTGIDRDCQDKEKAIKHSWLTAFRFYPDNLCLSPLIFLF